jgi:hypothetical protein
MVPVFLSRSGALKVQNSGKSATTLYCAILPNTTHTYRITVSTKTELLDALYAWSALIWPQQPWQYRYRLLTECRDSWGTDEGKIEKVVLRDDCPVGQRQLALRTVSNISYRDTVHANQTRRDIPTGARTRLAHCLSRSIAFRRQPVPAI